MKVLYCNPVFFEYRLPFYEELERLFKGDFYVMYSPVRYRMCRKEVFCQEIKARMGDNAVPFMGDHLFDTNSKKWDVMPDIEKGKRIPFVWGLMRAIGKVKPDVLITEGYFQWTPLVLLYGLLHGVPVYMGYERTKWTERNCGKLKLLQRKLFNRFFAGFIVNGSETRDYLMSIGVPAEKIHVGGMSADSERLRMGVEEFQSSKGFKEVQARFKKNDGLVFLFTGVIAERKGVTHLLEAWKEHVKKHGDDSLVLVGDGNQMEICKDMCKGMPSVMFEGRVPYDEIPQYYAIADVYILPTIEDNWSLVIPEAMACGLPIATSIYNGCHVELIKDGVNGFVFDSFKHDTIVEVLDKFHSADLNAMGKASVKLEEPFNAENSALRVYNAISKE